MCQARAGNETELSCQESNRFISVSAPGRSREDQRRVRGKLKGTGRNTLDQPGGCRNAGRKDSRKEKEWVHFGALPLYRGSPED